MRKHIFVSRTFFIALFLFVAGCFCLKIATTSYGKYKSALDFKSYTAEDYLEGKYVVGEINSYVVKEFKGVLGSSYSGQSATLFHGLARYDTYTIPIEDNRYIRVMVKDRGKVNQLERFSQGKGEPVTIKGIVYPASEINYEWYEGIEEFDADTILPDVVIKEVNLDDIIKMASPGIMFLVMAVICLVFGDAIEFVTVTDDEEI